MKIIKTVEGTDVFVSEEDYPFISFLYELYIDSNGYVNCRLKRGRRGLGQVGGKLHRIITQAPQGRNNPVDHKNRNKLDNTRENLRNATHKQNMQNRVQNKVKDSSKFKGVYFNKDRKKWRVNVHRDGVKIHKGYFTNEIAAANAYNFYSKEVYGEYANLNDVKFMEKEEWMKYKSDNKSSKYKGVTLDKRWGKYIVQIWDGVNKKHIRLGRFDDEIEAARAYNKKIIELRGEKAILNDV